MSAHASAHETAHPMRVPIEIAEADLEEMEWYIASTVGVGA